eukprot:scaffold93117_cov43-Phaeocystis_antarctica.AAC.1
MGTSAAAGSVLTHQRLRQPDSALRALAYACVGSGVTPQACMGVDIEHDFFRSGTRRCPQLYTP